MMTSPHTHLYPSSQPTPQERSLEIELRGHIVDSGILAKAMDLVVEYNGDFDTEEFSHGQEK